MSAWIVVVIGLACGGAGFMAGIKREIRMLREMLDFRYSPW